MVVTARIDVEGTQLYNARDIDVRSTIGENNSASSFTALFDNEAGRNESSFTVGDEILVFADDSINVHNYAFPYTFDIYLLNPIFAGVLEQIQFAGKGEKEQIIIKGRDYVSLLQDTTIEPTVYNNQEASVIVKDIIDTFVPNITTRYVDTTETTVDHISFNHTPVFDALKQLSELSTFTFWVDSSRNLHFEEKGSVSSLQTIDNTNAIKANFKETDREIVNEVWVYGDRFLTGAQDTFTANGGSVYTLTYKPHNTNVYVGGSTAPKVGGIFEMTVGTPGSPTQYLVSYYNRQVIFVSGASPQSNNIPISGTDAIKIDYERSVPIVKYGLDRVSIDTYGKHTKVIVDSNIKDPNAAKDMVLDELNRNSMPKKQGKINLQGILHFTAGNTVIVNLPYHDVDSETFDILEVKYNFNPANNLHSNVLQLKVSQKIDDITDTIKQMMLDIKKLQAAEIDDADELTRLEIATGSFGIRVAEWYVKYRNIGSAFILGHSENGVLGAVTAGSLQPYLGSGGDIVWYTADSGGSWT